MDKKLNFEKIEVFDESGNKQIKMTFDNIDLKATFNNKYFSTSENMKTVDITENNDRKANDELDNKSSTSTANNSNEEMSESQNKTTESTISEENEISERKESTKTESNTKANETISIEDTVYPMYLPSGTYLSNEESVSKEDGERIILTFAGESPFILVEETVSKSEETEIIPVYGEPTILVDTVGALSDSSVNFISNGIEYYIASESMTMQEILEVAQSISSVPVMK